MKTQTTTPETRKLEAAPASLRRLDLRKALADQDGLDELLGTFEPITLAEMDAVRLMDRSEVKYAMPRGMLLPMLAELRPDYRAFVIAGHPWSRYKTLYYDTDDMKLYMRHHAGATDRYKVRTREYVDSQIAFLEVKHKTSPIHTIKNRIPVPDAPMDLRGAAADFLADACPYPAEALHPRLWNYSTRITLVNKNRPERVTLDIALGFAWGEAAAVVPGIVVAEVKYQGSRHESEFIRLMRKHYVRETSFSKYCVGVSMLYPEIKHNKFKAKQRLVARLSQGGNNDLR